MSVQLGLNGYPGTYIPGSACKSSENASRIRQAASTGRGVVYPSGTPERAYQDWYWRSFKVDWLRWKPPAPLEEPQALPAAALPCLYSNNDSEKADLKLNRLSGYHKKQAECIHRNARQFIDQYGLANVGFLTLTFPDNVTDPDEAYRRFKSMNVSFLSKRFGDWILVKERQRRGAWHYHLLIDCRADIREGFDFELLRMLIDMGKTGRDLSPAFKSANGSLRAVWSDLRASLPKYGFGRSELLPLRSNSEAVGRYIGKYISKHVGVRASQDKGVRLFSSSGGFRRANTRFAWNSAGNWVWRMKLKTYAEFRGCRSYDELQEFFGSKWSHDLFDEIFETALPAGTRFPTIRHWQAYACEPPGTVPLGYEEGMVNFIDPDMR